VIAIENVRLFNETKEALERQTADCGNPQGDMQVPPADGSKPVLDAVAEKRGRGCAVLTDALISHGRE
jgi:hypothetical protein